MTASVGPRTVVIHSASSSALDTVADRHTSRTLGARWMMTSSHTGPAVGVLEVVDLVEHHVAQVAQRRRARVDHVAQHLGGHHHDRGVAVDRRCRR